MDELDTISSLLSEFFDDPAKAVLWLEANNPEFGDLSPLKMIKSGRGQRVIKYIRASLEDGCLKCTKEVLR